MVSLVTPSSFKRVFVGDDDSYAGVVPTADLLHVAGSYGPILRVGSTPTADYVIAADSARIDVRVHGAVGDGVTNDTAALLAALAAVPAAGGDVFLPAGHTFLFSAPLPAKSKTTITGGGKLKAAAIGSWASSPYYGITNVNNTASVITDTDITVRGITIDYTDLPAADGTRHTIYIRKARRITIENVTTIQGSSAVALLGCNDTTEIGNRLTGFTNCGSDHWDSPSMGKLIGCHIESGAAAQLVNWNAIPTSGSEAGTIADGFTMTGNTLVSTAATETPIQIEPLGTLGETRDAVITGNKFVNSYVVSRGLVNGLVVVGNDFSGFTSTASAIFCFARNGSTPTGIVVQGNVIRNPLTSSGNVGVIRVETDSALISGNVIMGTGYAAQPISGNAAFPQVFGNYAEIAQLAGYLQIGFNLKNGSAAYAGWTDASGSHPRIFVQSDNNWIMQSTDGSGAARTVMSIYSRSSTSELIFSTPVLVSSTHRHTPVTGIAAAGTTISAATVLTANYNEVTSATVGSADGVRLSALNAFPQVVTNSTAVTINVFPQNSGSGSIDGGAAAAAVTLAAGKSKTFFHYATNNYRTVAAT